MISEWVYTVEKYDPTRRVQNPDFYGEGMAKECEGLQREIQKIAERVITANQGLLGSKPMDDSPGECAFGCKCSKHYQAVPNDVIASLTKERDEWKARADSYLKMLNKKITDADSRDQLADNLAIAESDRDNYLRLWTEMSGHWEDLRRYIGSKACARCDQLRAKERK